MANAPEANPDESDWDTDSSRLGCHDNDCLPTEADLDGPRACPRNAYMAMSQPFDDKMARALAEGEPEAEVAGTTDAATAGHPDLAVAGAAGNGTSVLEKVAKLVGKGSDAFDLHEVSRVEIDCAMAAGDDKTAKAGSTDAKEGIGLEVNSDSRTEEGVAATEDTKPEQGAAEGRCSKPTTLSACC